MTTFIRTQRQRIAWTLILIFVVNTFSPVATYALTSGPSQPEHQGFQPASTTDMVDLFSGDFSYNIPLFELPGPNGGYPFNLSYQAGIAMDQEASWVGLGWTLNPGAINRQVRGLPDDFKGATPEQDPEATGDKVTTSMAIEPAYTAGIGLGTSLEFFGAGEDLGSAGLSIFYNNYKGFGYNVDATVGFSPSVQSGATHGIRAGAYISLNSQEGPTIAPSLSLAGKLGQFSLTAPYNAMSGFDQLAYSYSRQIQFKGKSAAVNGTDKTSYGVTSVSSGSLGLTSPGYTPQITMPMRNVSINAEFNAGGALFGTFPKGYVKGFYTQQKLPDDVTKVISPAFGYLNYDLGQSNAKAMLDFNREKDGIVTKESPNLAIPSLTYDIYSVSGQGIGAMYRPIRNDIGIISDPKVESESVGTALGVDIAPGFAHVGVNLSVNHAKSTSGPWTDDNDMYSAARFQSAKEDDSYEPWNFKAHGEMTGERKLNLDNIGGGEAVRVKLGPAQDGDPKATTILQYSSTSPDLPHAFDQMDRTRKQRNEVIQTYTNEQILKLDGCNPAVTGKPCEIINFFQNSYYTSAVDFYKTDPGTILDRRQFPSNHIAGFTALTSGGLRYNYTIPVYNNVQEEVVFSVDRSQRTWDMSNAPVPAGTSNNPGYKPMVSGKYLTENFLKKTETSAYATSYLLTSIVGPDYVDVDNNGVSEKDLGYWIKFTYENITTESNPYKWREPYYGAHFIEGYRSYIRDDKASYTYGEKQLWYLAKAESKTHIANFKTKLRNDNVGAFNRFQNTGPTTGMRTLALDWIGLYSRAEIVRAILAGQEPYLIKKVMFNSLDLLCGGVPNSVGENYKLALTSLVFRYGNSTRGDLNPYTFSYNGASYDQRTTDRWGLYKPLTGIDQLQNIDAPYSDQGIGQTTGYKLQTIDVNASAWNLTRIVTPSGSTINVDYETDEYAYVQHKQAMQMFQALNPNGAAISAESNPRYDLSDSNLKIRFKLQSPINSPDMSPEDQRKEVLRYLDQDRGQLAFKVSMNLRTSAEDNTEEFIYGYAKINMDGPMALEIGDPEEGIWSYGTFYLKSDDDGNVIHPFSLRAWQHLRTNQPDLAAPGYQDITSANGDKGAMVNQIKALATPFKGIRQLFGGFNTTCQSNHWGREINSAKSFIRLNSVNKTAGNGSIISKSKYGGGARVKQITIKDGWDDDDDGLYGQAYDYTMEEDGETISSGVATYEPMNGGEENSLRYAKTYYQSVPLRADNNLFFEYPANESYYPAPHVGYRKVTVMSLASGARAGVVINSVLPHRNFATGDNAPMYGTTGKTVHEFYTAKDFPVITDETDKYDQTDRLSVPIPFLGNLSVSKMTSTQGYSITTNDMHGKLKKMSTYRQTPVGAFEEKPISWVKYNYASDSIVYDKEKVYALSNNFKFDAVHNTLSLSTPEAADYTMGQENEFFLDMRQFEDNAWEGGAKVNTDLVWIFLGALPVPTVWPSIGKSNTLLRTTVANKVIFKPGVLESVEAYDGGSLVKTQNLKWDKLTGQVVLSKVNNNFDHDVFSYTVPAYTQYTGLSGAYQNIGLKINVPGLTPLKDDGQNFVFSSKNDTPKLFPGDEIVLTRDREAIVKVIYMGERSDGLKWVYSQDVIDRTEYAPTLALGIHIPRHYTGIIVRSGFRNQLNATAGTITALKDPSIPPDGSGRTHTKTLLSNQ